MKVQRVQDAGGSHIEPPLDQDWLDLEKLEWLCAVMLEDHGMRARVHEDSPGQFCINIPGTGLSGRSYQSAWRTLTDLGTGYAAGLAARVDRGTVYGGRS